MEDTMFFIVNKTTSTVEEVTLKGDTITKYDSKLNKTDLSMMPKYLGHKAKLVFIIKTSGKKEIIGDLDTRIKEVYLNKDGVYTIDFE